MDLRPSPIAGTWYPGDAESLAISIDQFLHDVDPKNIRGQIVGLIVPHAGHRYSGGVAAHAFRLIQGYQPEVIVVISPLHTYADEVILTTDHDAYATPLGAIPVDHDLTLKLAAQLEQEHGLKLGRIRNDREHSLEIELPFLQRCIKSAYSLVPIMVREQSKEVAQALGQELGKLMQDRPCLIIASSDLSHFYPQEVAERLDRAMLDRLEQFDPPGLIEAEQEGRGFACGRGAIAATLWSTQSLGANRVKVLTHATSGDITGDYDSVVGYGSAVIYHEV